MSLLAAFVAMLGKQWLNRYLRHTGGSMIERCGDRQRKCDGLQRWPFRLFIESLPVMLQIALLLLACGLCKHMTSVNPSVAYTLITLTGLGVLFYIGVVIAGASSYACPFQTPGSALLRGSCAKFGARFTPIVFLIINALRTLGGTVWRHSSVVNPPLVAVRRHFSALFRSVQLRIPHISFRLPWMGLIIRHHLPHPPLPTTQQVPHLSDPRNTVSWFAPDEVAVVQMNNTNNIRCVSWVLRNITDPEALDVAIRLAGTIRWFEDGVDVKPLYDLILFTFHTCFGSNVLRPGLRDRAYYSGRAILWIHTLAMCKSEEFARMFRLPPQIKGYTTPASDHDLSQILASLSPFPPGPQLLFWHMCAIHDGHTRPHSQWISSLLLRLSRVSNTIPRFLMDSVRFYLLNVGAGTPTDMTFNCLLMCCNLLGSPVGEEVLKIQDKSYGISCPYTPSNSHIQLFTSDCMPQVLYQVSGAITSALETSHPQRELVRGALYILTRLESHPSLEAEAHGWCAAIWENRQGNEDWESLFLLSLEAGFRHLDPSNLWTFIYPTRSEYPQELINTVLECHDSEAVTDLIYASYIIDHSGQLALRICANYAVDLNRRGTEPFSPRMRGIFSRCIESGGLVALEEMGEERFVGLLNRLHVGVEDVVVSSRLTAWTTILLEIIQSPEGARHLAIQSWELLAELTTSGISKSASYAPDVTAYLLEAQEWDKLEHWMGVVWMAWPPQPSNILEHTTALLFHRRPGAVQKLTEWMERWSKKCRRDVPEPFQQICKQAHEQAL